MFRIRLLMMISLVIFCAVYGVKAQEIKPVQSTAAPVITVAASAERVRFTAPNSVMQMHLQVYDNAGQLVFDVSAKGNVLDWTLQDSGGARLNPGAYLSVVTVKSLSGKLSQRIGSVSVQDKQIELQRVGAAQMTAGQQLAVGPVEENGVLTILNVGDAAATTVVAHDGTQGEITRSRGALSFRLGDFFSGADEEQMRLTAEGNLGIGTDNPQSKLEVAGDIRATGAIHANSIQFPNGTVLTSGQSGTLAAQGNLGPNVTGTGTQGRIAKWADNSGTLGDSLLNETGNMVELRALSGIGVNPTFTNPNKVAGFAQFSFYPSSGTNTNMSFSAIPRGTGAANNRAQISVFGTDFIADSNNYEFAALRARDNDFVFGTGKSGTGVNRPFMLASGFLADNTTNNGQLYLGSNGNVGVGTTIPEQKLEVAGNVKVSGNGNRFIFADGTSMATAGATLAANSFNGNQSVTGAISATSSINTDTQYNIGGNRVFSVAGSQNVFAGVSAGQANTTGFENSFFGDSAGFNNTEGNSNSFFGSLAGFASTTGNSNSFFGQAAGFRNTIGGSNSFFGATAGNHNTMGANNSFFGFQAGQQNTTGGNNVFFGQNAGRFNTTAGNNSFFGSNAGGSNTTGTNNAFFGRTAGSNNTTGGGNTIIGDNANVGANNLNNATAIGANASVTQSSSLVLGSINGVNGASTDTSVGIGTTAPTQKLEVAGNVKVSGNGNGFMFSDGTSMTTAGASLGTNSFSGDQSVTGTISATGSINTDTQYNIGGGRVLSAGGATSLFAGFNTGATSTGANNSFFGDSAGQANTTGSGNSFFGESAGNKNTQGGSNSFFGNSAGTNNTAGGGNSFFGNSAGSSNTTGGGNSFFGDSAGFSNTASKNSFFGYQAGIFNTAGDGNSFFGNQAGQFNSTGFNNSFFGDNAGQQNTTGGANSFFGWKAGNANTTGLQNAFFGYFAGLMNSMGASNSFFGFEAGKNSTTGSANSFFGIHAGSNNGSGIFNTFVGADAGASNTVENDNTFVGHSANGTAGITNASAIGANASVTQSNSLVLGSINGVNDATANTNVGIGTTAPTQKLEVAGNVKVSGNGNGFMFADGTSMTTVGASLGDNSFNGNQSVTGTISATGSINTDTQYNIGGGRVLSVAGTQNVFAGVGAGQNNTGTGNSFFGSGAGLLNSSGFNNSFFGREAGEANTVGDSNSFFGRRAAFFNTTGGSNSFFGEQAGFFNSQGNNNTFIGNSSGFSNSDGSNNSFVGSHTAGAASITNATAVGYRAQVTQNNSLVLGSINGVNGATADTKVGIGTTSPTNRLSVVGTVDFSGNVGVGTTAPQYKLHVVGQDLRVESSTPSSFPRFSLNFIGGAVDEKRWQNYAAPSALNFSALNDAENTETIWLQVHRGTGAAISSIVFPNGNVGINTLNPDHTLTVNGTADKPGGGSWDVFSDERLKTIKGRFLPGLKAVMQLQPLRYEYKADNALGLRSSEEHIGFGAQAVQKIIPEAVTKNDRGYLLVNNDPILWTMLNAIKEQQNEIQVQRLRAEQQQQQLQQKRERIGKLEARLAALETAVKNLSVRRRPRRR